MIYLEGKIMDQRGDAIPNAVVFPGVVNANEFIPGPDAITGGTDGIYSISYPSLSDTVEFSAPGYVTRLISVDESNSAFNVVLKNIELEQTAEKSKKHYWLVLIVVVILFLIYQPFN